MTLEEKQRQFFDLVNNEDKIGCVKLADSWLAGSEMPVEEFYTHILGPAMNMPYCEGSDGYCIWKEHVRSSIIRTVLENCYKYVMASREKTGIAAGVGIAKAIVMCPGDEQHELGARIVSDFFCLAGFDVNFIWRCAAR